MARQAAAVNRADLDEVARTIAADLVALDHRPLGWPTLDSDGLVAKIGTAMSEPASYVMWGREVRAIEPGVVLVAHDVITTGPSGRWQSWWLVSTADGQIQRAENFGDDVDAALARYDEVAGGEGGARPLADVAGEPAVLSNAVLRLVSGGIEAFNQGDMEALAAGLTVDCVRRDHRLAPTQGVTQGVDAIVELQNVASEIGRHEMAISPVATRGQRLAVIELTLVTDYGRDVHYLLLEANPDLELLSSYDYFDSGDLASATAMLDERYAEQLPPELASVFRVAAAPLRAINSEDYAVLRDTVSSDMEMLDHRSASWPQLDREGLIDRMEGTLGFGYVGWYREVKRLTPAGLLASYESVTTAPETSRLDLLVGMVDAGKFCRGEQFGEDDYEAALARFDELDAEQRAAAVIRLPALENAATRPLAVLADVVVKDLEQARPLIATDFRLIDHRPGVSAPDIGGRDDYMSYLEASLSVSLTDPRYEIVAVRGDRQALVRGSWSASSGSEIVFLMVIEVNQAGQVLFFGQYSTEQIAAALEYLDQLWLEGDGRDARPSTTPLFEFDQAAAAGDMEKAQALLATDFVAVDRRQLGWPEMDGAAFIEGRFNGADDLNWQRTLATVAVPKHNATMALRHVRSAGEWAEGSEYSREYLVVTEVRSGLCARAEFFDTDDYEAALARFDELERAGSMAADAPCHETLVPANRSSEVGTAIVVAFGAQDWDALEAVLADGVELVDDRTGPTTTRAFGRDAVVARMDMMANFKATADVGYVAMLRSLLAVRGQTLNLSLGGFITNADQRSERLTIEVLDNSDRLARLVSFDPDDFAAAVEALDELYIEGEGAEHADQLRPFIEFERAANRSELDAAAAVLDSEFVAVDHRQMGFPQMTAEEFLEVRMEAPDDIEVDRVVYTAAIYAQHDAWSLRVIRTAGARSGAQYENGWLMVTEVAQGKIRRVEFFPDEALDAATARFAELAGPPATESTDAGQTADD